MLPNDDVMIRVMLTGFITALAVGLTFPLSLLIDRSRTRPAGLFGVSVVVIEFILALLLIWMSTWLSWRREHQLALTMWTVAMVGVFILLYLLAVRAKRGRTAGFVGIATAGIALIACMLGNWLPGRPWQHNEWWETGWTIGGFGLLGALTLLGFGRGDTKHWRWLGVAATVGAIVTMFLEIWRGTGSIKVFSLMMSAGMVIALANLIYLLSLKSGQKWVRLATLGSAVTTAVLINVLVITDFDVAEDTLLRIVAAAGIVTACGTLALVVLAVFNRRSDAEFRTAKMMAMTVFCPRCNRKQSIPLGRSACPGCGLRIEIRIEEPRCPTCDYLLYRLTSNRCPECGTLIARGQADATEAGGTKPAEETIAE